jgi:hypothetical protein
MPARPDDFQVVAGIENFLGDPRGAANHQRIVFTNDVFEFPGRKPCDDIHIDPFGIFKYLNPRVSEGVADKHLDHLLVSSLSCM